MVARCASWLCLAAVASWPAVPARAAKPIDLVRAIDADIDAWHPEDALDALANLQSAAPADPMTQLAAAKLEFQLGRYAQAVSALDALKAQAGVIEAYADLDGLVRTTAAKTAAMVPFRSAHFAVFAEPGPDTVLAPFALDTLESALRALHEDLGADLPAAALPVRVEIYPRTADFVGVSTLTAKEVATSGTIALCKFNRLMIVSPRRLARGYRWRDTLNHELTHFVLSRMTDGQLPLWLHEGIAKFEERRWQAPQDGQLHPIQQSILAEARRRGVYVPFRDMMPSLAKLDSGWKTSLAFAEVTLLVKQIVADGGTRRLRDVVDAYARGDAPGRRALGITSVDDLWSRFVARLKTTPLDSVPGYKFIPPTVAEDEVDAEPEPIGEEAARKFARLGDLLREQGHWSSAISEYTKARSELGFTPAPLSLRFAEAYMVGGMYVRAESELQVLVQRDPDRATAHLLLGKIALFRNDPATALKRYETAFAIAPFHNEVLQGLVDAAERAGAGDKLQAYRQAMEAWNDLRHGG